MSGFLRPRKNSKRALYLSAFELFCDGKSLAECAATTGLDLALLERCAHTQNWQRRQAQLLGASAVGRAETRLQAKAAVDNTLVNATRSAAQTLAQAYVKLIEEAASLPTHPYAAQGDDKPDANETYRQECAMIDRKADTMRKATEGLRELIETAQNIGLLEYERGGKPQGGNGGGDGDGKPLDLSRLTQLNIAIVQATNGQPQRVAATLAPASGETRSDLRNSEPITVDAKTGD